MIYHSKTTPRWAITLSANLKPTTMGWKSTIDITREQAILLATKELSKKISEIYTMSDAQLEDLLEELGYGDTQGMEYFGHNFNVINN
jgi:hypothetical protein